MTKLVTREHWTLQPPFWAQPLRAPNRADGRPAFLTFQGGGAKGIVHVGALMAVEELSLTVRGVAGTSAGAMIAALAAARYSGRELMNPDPNKPSHLLLALGEARGFEKATDFFSPFGWLCIRLLRWVTPRLKLVGGVILLVLLFLCWLDLDHPAVVVAAMVLLTLACAVPAYFLWRGITTVKYVRDFIDYAIAQRVTTDAGRDITFKDLHEAAGSLPLKVVATNVTEECVEVFSFERTPSVIVADAVAASICLPAIFQPWRFDCQRGAGVAADLAFRSFLDGGMTSNLPVWTLDAERAQFESSMTIAFTIRPDASPRPKARHWLPAVLTSVIAGSMEIHTRAVSNMLHVPIECGLKLFDFDAGTDTFYKVVESARAAVDQRLRQEITEFPLILADGCEAIRSSFGQLLASAEGSRWYPHGQVPEVKVGLACRPLGSFGELSIPYHAGYRPHEPEGDPELLTAAWEDNASRFALFEGGGAWDRDHWVIHIPVSRRLDGEPLPRIEGLIEKPMVIVIATDAEFDRALFSFDSDDEQREGPLDEDAIETEEEFESFVETVSDSVIKFCEEKRLYDAIQRSTSSPWH